METNSNVQNNDLEIVQDLLNTVKECLSDYMNTIISGGNVRRTYIACRKGGYVISTTLSYKLLEFFKLNENNYKVL